jgi:hypothetical protein
MSNTVIGEDGNLYDTWTSGSSADKSINASNAVLKPVSDQIESDSSTYFGPFVSQGFLDLYSRVNNGPASGINSQETLETKVI